MWVPVQFSGINQSSQRNSLVPLISWFYYFPDSRPVSPYPHLSFVLISSKAKEGLFLSLPLSPFLSTLPPLQSAFHAGEALSSGSTRKRAKNGHLGPVTPRLLCIFILYRTGDTSLRRCIRRCMEGLYLTPRLLFCI